MEDRHGITSQTETSRPKQNHNSPLFRKRVYEYYTNTNPITDTSFAINSLLIADAEGEIDAVKWVNDKIIAMEEMAELGFKIDVSEITAVAKYVIAAMEFMYRMHPTPCDTDQEVRSEQISCSEATDSDDDWDIRTKTTLAELTSGIFCSLQDVEVELGIKKQILWSLIKEQQMPVYTLFHKFTVITREQVSALKELASTKSASN